MTFIEVLRDRPPGHDWELEPGVTCGDYLFGMLQVWLKIQATFLIVLNNYFKWIVVSFFSFHMILILISTGNKVCSVC